MKKKSAKKAQKEEKTKPDDSSQEQKKRKKKEEAVKQKKKKEKKADKKKDKGPNIFKLGNDLIKGVRHKSLEREIKAYGYEYSFKKYMASVMLVLILLVMLSALFSLDVKAIACVAVSAILAFPVIVRAQYAYTHNNDRFEELTSYMYQMIVSFRRTPKILHSMQVAREVAEGKMRECLDKAIYIIENDTSTKTYEKAFAVIESEYRCSRLRTLHRFIHTVETKSSTDYASGLESLHQDIQDWVTRVHKYQAALAATKKKVVIILFLSIGIAIYFSYVLKQAEESMAGNQAAMNVNFEILSNPVYQVATALFLIVFIIIYTILNSKINGFWLVNDISDVTEEDVIANLDYINNFDMKKSAKNSKIAVLFALPIVVAGIFMKQILLVAVGVALSAFMLFLGKLKYNARKKAVERELLKEFPLWMRDVAINLNNMVVLNAVKMSIDNASAILKPFLVNFVEEVEKNPTSFAPYKNFLGIFSVFELSSAVQLLHSIRYCTPEEAQSEIANLIERNHLLLEASEKIRHDDSISGVSFISMLPMVLLSFKLILDMGLMMGQFLGLISSSGMI